MTSFSDTSTWQLKNDGMLSYYYTAKGEKISSTSEKRPQSLLVQVETLAVHDVASWQLKDDGRPERHSV